MILSYIFTLVIIISIRQRSVVSFSQIIIVSNTFSLIRYTTCLSLKTFININVSLFLFVKLISLIIRFKKFKKRVKSELKIATRDVLFK